MKLLLDENLSPKTAALIRSLGLDATHANDVNLKGKSDEEIYKYCKDKHYTLVTFDHEFSFKYISRKDLEGLVVIRVHPQTFEILHPILENFFSQVKKRRVNLKGNISVIERSRFRIRRVV